MRILFCGDTFPAARILLQERLPNDDVYVCRDYASLSEVRGVDVLIPMMFIIDAAVMDGICPKLIQQWGSGVEGVSLDSARERGIPVASVPTSGFNADSVAEHALLLILALLRQLPLAQANVRSGILGSPLGRMLAGRTVCLWGLGATALALARRLRPFNVRLLGITRDPSAPKVAGFGLDRCYSTEDRIACIRETDILVLCVRLNDQTRGLVDSNVLATLRKEGYLVNAARGALVDYNALYAALSSGHLGGAGLDVFWAEPISPDDPLLMLPNLIATPHVAGVTDRSYAAIADAVVANIERFRRNEQLVNRVP